jgi:hypothetical protein
MDLVVVGLTGSESDLIFVGLVGPRLVPAAQAHIRMRHKRRQHRLGFGEKEHRGCHAKETKHGGDCLHVVFFFFLVGGGAGNVGSA